MSTLSPKPPPYPPPEGEGIRPRGGRGIWQIAMLFAFALSACQQAASPTTVLPTTLPVSTPSPATTPVPTPPPAPALALDQVGAAASPSGFSAFAVVSNPTAQTALEVTVEIAELDGRGQVVMRRGGTIPRIAAGQREAVAVAFPVGRILPAQFSGRIGDVRWISETSPEIAQVTGASFSQDARTPTVRIHVVNNGQGAARMILIAVCWDAAGNIRGGGSRTITVGPGAEGLDVTVAVWIATVPTRCDGYGITVS
ncbi:MAG TPA: hypothetical protein VN973_00065 [Candidatus Dormibacteraeota bacterium]|nr:hypothetical protein [Candidatus Dormibacteraeota bacterium]